MSRTTGLSFSHPEVQRLRGLLARRADRYDERAFVIEGATLLGEAVDAGWEIQGQYLAPGAVPVPGAGPAHELAVGVLERVASTQSPQPVLGVATMPAPDQAVMNDARFVVVADQLSDPGNAGTILRSAEAAGADAVVLTPGSVDPYNPKVVRAAAGALFRIPVCCPVTLDDIRRLGLTLYGTSSHDGEDYCQVDLTGRVAIVVGNEAHGLADDAPVDRWITIPHGGRAESLNVAMATTVLCFEVARQRRSLPGTIAD